MATSATSSASSSAGTYFTGNSTFSADLNNRIAHAVAVATLPITQLQNQQSTITGEQTELQKLGGDFSTFQTAIGAIDHAVSSGSLAASVANTSVASASIGAGALAGSYSVNITNLGAQANTISTPTNSNTVSTANVADPTSASVSSSSTFTLTVGTTSYSLTTASNTLDSLVDAINASGANVQASVVNIGSTASPSYQLSIQGTAATAGSVQLNDGTSNLLGTTNTASPTGVLAVTDPSAGSISTSSTFSLTVGAQSYSLTPASNTLNALVAAINASGANVQATLVNVGGSANPNYELSIQGNQYASAAIQLNDGSHNLLTTMSAGAPVTYAVNGQAPVTSNTRSLSISTGLTVNALATGTANVTVEQSSVGIQNALASLVTSYNAAADELTSNRGQNGGALAGNSVIQQLSNVLQGIANYSSASSGSIHSLTDLGLSFDTNGHLQFDSTVFSAATSSSLNDVMSFLGSESANSGFLGAANTALSAVTDTSSGLVVQQISSFAGTIANLGTTITNDQARVTLLQSNLTAQMEAADAAVASLQSQATEISAMFAAEQVQTQANAVG
jgi:flagellar hook-associated protein 2